MKRNDFKEGVKFKTNHHGSEIICEVGTALDNGEFGLRSSWGTNLEIKGSRIRAYSIACGFPVMYSGWIKLSALEVVSDSNEEREAA